jgi:hypothetical protein
MISSKLRSAIEASCKKRKLSAATTKEVIRWAEMIEIGHGMLECVENGSMEIVSMKKGEPNFWITPAGVQEVNAMLFKKK